VSGDLEFAEYEARIRFTAPAFLPQWSGNALRSGFGARLREMVCLRPNRAGAGWEGAGTSRNGSSISSAGGSSDDCQSCLQRNSCVYDYFYNARPPADAKVLRRQSDPPRPFAFGPPAPGRYEPGDEARLGFTLIGLGVQHLPYFLLGLRNLGESGIGKGYREGRGRFVLESVDSVGYGKRENIFSGNTVYNRSILLSYRQILQASSGHEGDLTISFTSPAQIKEEGRFTAVPSFRGLISRLLSRANILAEYYGSGSLYDGKEALSILGQCRQVAVAGADTRDLWQERYFHKGKSERRPLAPFFSGRITYAGEFSQDMMALLELGRHIHVGKMATFGNGGYEIRV